MADVRVDVKVDDKGSLKKVGKSAQSARRQIGGVAKTASFWQTILKNVPRNDWWTCTRICTISSNIICC